MPHTILYKCRLCWISSFVVIVLLLLFCCCCFVVIVLFLMLLFCFCCFIVLTYLPDLPAWQKKTFFLIQTLTRAVSQFLRCFVCWKGYVAKIFFIWENISTTPGYASLLKYFKYRAKIYKSTVCLFKSKVWLPSSPQSHHY